MANARLHREMVSPAPAGSEEQVVVDSRREYVCDCCRRRFTGLPGGAGLLMWTRGDERRYEEPPLCPRCAEKITIGALVKWESEADGEQ